MTVRIKAKPKYHQKNPINFVIKSLKAWFSNIIATKTQMILRQKKSGNQIKGNFQAKTERYLSQDYQVDAWFELFLYHVPWSADN